MSCQAAATASTGVVPRSQKKSNFFKNRPKLIEPSSSLTKSPINKLNRIKVVETQEKTVSQRSYGAPVIKKNQKFSVSTAKNNVTTQPPPPKPTHVDYFDRRRPLSSLYHANFNQPIYLFKLVNFNINLSHNFWEISNLPVSHLSSRQQRQQSNVSSSPPQLPFLCFYVPTFSNITTTTAEVAHQQRVSFTAARRPLTTASPHMEYGRYVCPLFVHFIKIDVISYIVRTKHCRFIGKSHQDHDDGHEFLSLAREQKVDR